MKFRISALFVLFAVLLPPGLYAQSSSADIQKFFQQFFEERLRDEPEYATNVGRHESDDRWTDWSKAGRDLRRAHLQQRLDALGKFPLDGLNDADRLSARLLSYDLRIQLDSLDLDTYLLRVGQLYGFHNRVYLLVDRMPARTVHDYENIIARLHAVPAYVDQNIGIMNEAIEHGWVQPAVVVDLVVKQLTAQVAQDATNTPLLIAFRQIPANIPEAEQARLRKQGTDAYQNDFLPAWRKLLNYVQTTYASKARSGVGIGSLPGGKEAYQILIRRLTTTNMTPEEIHRLGEAEVTRIEAEMLAIAKETGFNGTIAEFEAKLSATPEQHFHSKDEMLAYCRNAAKIIEPELPNQFKRIPLLLYGIRAIPEDREQATASNAQAPTADGSTPGWFNLNAYQPEKQVRYDKESLVLHEAVPGHVFQGALARSMKDLPEFRKYYGNSAYAEGWALYAESLGSQLGMYRDPYSRFGQLASERFRAARLVIDTGIHSMGWTRDQARDYLAAHAPQVSQAEIDRYISWPSQALAYKIGQLRISQLRHEAEQQLGQKFDVREFHDVVLRDGTLPLDLLQEQVRKYIAATK